MSKPQQASGCQKMLRRSFLFLFGMAATQVLAEYFSLPQNRDKTVKLLSQLWQKVLAFRSKNDPDVIPPPVNKGPIAQISPTPQPLIINEKDRPNIEPFGHQGKSQLTKIPPKKARPLEFGRRTVGGVSFYQTTIDLTDPETFITTGLANNASFANNATLTNGDEAFEKLVDRYKAAVIVSGTFFGKDTQKAVLGNMVAGGKFLKYSRWENYGTTLGIKAGNQLEMVTARTEGQPQWNEHWFSLTCGPRLVRQGKVWLSPLSEGFKDSHVLGVGARSAIGFPASKQQLFLVTFLQSLSLQQEAEIMKAIGCMEAMNLDGGASVALARKGRILLAPGRNLTNVIVVYDTEYRAPEDLKMSWQRFQNGDRPLYP